VSSARAVNRRVVLLICCTSILLVGIDMTALNVALPTIGNDLHASLSGLPWIIDAYTLTLSALLMFSSSMADRFGRKRIFQTGLVTFVTGSALCAVAPSLGTLIVFRVIQATGGSMLNPVAMSIIANTYPDHAERARAIGIWAAVTGLSLAVGPIVGGALIGAAANGWRFIFLINLPIGLTAAALAQRFVPESKAATPRRIDPVGQVLVALGLTALTYGVIEGAQRGWTSALIVIAFTVAVASLVGIIYYEPRRKDPLLELGFFRSIPFSGANLIAIAAFAALGSFLFVNSLYLQQVRHYSPLATGALMLPLAIVGLIYGPINGRILAKHGARPCLIVGGVAMAAAGVLLVSSTSSTPLPMLLFAYALIGLGNVAVGAPITHTAVAGMPPSQSGVAAGVSSASRQVGQTIGVAIVGAILASADPGGLAHHIHLAWMPIILYGAITLLLGFLTTTTWARARARRLVSSAA
jgi:EmrB/QacA subfamily drug resistance transporter